MIRIGTRALISIDGKPLLATHWDGYPSCLGLKLLNRDKTIPAIVDVAKEHTIDAADIAILEDLNRHRIKKLAKKHRLTQSKIKAGKRRGCVICAEDYEISNIDNYGDWAEYQYDIRGQVVYFRPLGGFYPKSLNKASRFKLLTKEAAKKTEMGDNPMKKITSLQKEVKMKIDKITFKNNKAWLAICSEDGEYLGTWHVINPKFVQVLQNEHPKNLRAW